ncbi:leucyl-cystinyl aminopeptidase [Sinocyclocheilus grahami]|uniref:Leucyl-cystinyl aminopeptidase-like n=1 Tax=Sinocyclocheilus grahami TaxID=75366 RepID=A0A672MTK9_SINGR|nr:PREDICTED: leucyl-cystinyl aminopeptidase-like [Sinocyclocheilus grahami]
METFESERAPLPRNMIENSMFEEEPDVVDLAKESPSYPIDSDDVVYEPRSSRLLVRGLGENDLDEDEEDYESSARLLGMSFMNRSSNQRSIASSYPRQQHSGSCLKPSTKTTVVGVLILVLVASMFMVIYFLPGCTFTRKGCQKTNSTMDSIYPISTSGERFPWTELRLPPSVHPVHYNISLHPNLALMTFQGCVSILVQVLHETKNIVLHSSDMNISKVTFEGKEVHVLEYKPWQQIAIKFPEDLKKGQYVLNINYTAKLSNSYDGFYNSSYVDTNGTKRVLAATQFEPLAARKALPCFNEPAFKSTFTIKMTRERKYISLSNMPKVKTTDLKNELQEDEFEKSVQMSTYLVAFIVAEFIGVSNNVSKTMVSVYAIPDKKDQVQYALDTACKLLKFYNTFFDNDYPLSKLDLVAIPDFLAGAMENWGLITFRETTLLVGSNSSSVDKQLVTSVVAHELAHQWFGNLVTMRWWNDLWLNEGFATYMQYMSIETVFPELNIDIEFLNVRFKALTKDALNSSHPVSTVVSTPEQVEEMFDSVSYEKGASILLMLNATLTDGEFRKGVIEYLQKYNLSNTESEDLWNSLSQVSKQNLSVSEMMNTWTVHKGFPLVTVKKNGTQVTLTQEHFLLNAENSTDDSSLWHIPLTYVNDSCSFLSSCKQVFHLKDKTATLKLPDQVKWLKFNFRNDGFYIVHYDEEGWKNLIDALKGDVNVLSCKDRAALINNIFTLSSSGKVSFRQVLNLMDYIRNETETAPLTEALFQLGQIYMLLDKRSELTLASRMTSYIDDHFGSLMAGQSWNLESSVSKMTLRSALLEMACFLNIRNCSTQAKHLFDQWFTSNKTSLIPSDLMRTVFKVAAQTDEGWGKLLDTYKHSINDQEKHKTLEALASTQDIRKIIWILQKSLDGSEIQTQEFPLVINAICKNFAGYLYAWDFVKENWDKITQKFPVGSFAIQSILMSATSQFSTKTHLTETQNFFTSLGTKGSQMRIVQEAIETIKFNMRWMEKNLNTLQRWL